MFTNLFLAAMLMVTPSSKSFQPISASYDSQITPACEIDWDGDYYQWQDMVATEENTEFDIKSYIYSELVPKSSTPNQVDYIYIDDLLAHLCSSDILFSKKLVWFSYQFGYKLDPDSFYFGLRMYFIHYRKRILIENFEEHIYRALKSTIEHFQVSKFEKKPVGTK